MSEQTGQSITTRIRHGIVHLAGAAGLAAPVVWLATAGLQVAQSEPGHSLVSRPERLFGATGSPLAGPLVIATVFWVWLWARLVDGSMFRAEHRKVRWLTLPLAALAGTAASGIVILGPSGPYAYQVSQGRGLAAIALLCLMPLTLIVAGAAIGRRGPAIAWLAAGVAVVMVCVTAWATAWSMRSGAPQPQLLAVMPVEGLAVLWAAAVGRWLPETPEAEPFTVKVGRHLPSLPVPGRKASAFLALIAVVGVVAVSGEYFRSVAPAIAAQLTGRTQVNTIRVGEIDRTYRVYRPSHTIDRPGLVIVLHGSFGGALQVESSTGFDSQADRLGWIAVYPDGVLDGWDTIPGASVRSHPGADDVAFISALIDRLAASDNLDPDRVFVTGISRGASMSYRLGCEISGRVAAVAPVSGNMAMADGSAAEFPCDPVAPVSVLAIHGTADGTIPIAGGRADVAYAPMSDVIDRWRALDACTGSGAVSTDGSSTTTSWVCQGGSAVQTRIVTGGRHAWPGAVAPPYGTSVAADDFDASRLIADFFAAHPRVP